MKKNTYKYQRGNKITPVETITRPATIGESVINDPRFDQYVDYNRKALQKVEQMGGKAYVNKDGSISVNSNQNNPRIVHRTLSEITGLPTPEGYEFIRGQLNRGTSRELRETYPMYGFGKEYYNKFKQENGGKMDYLNRYKMQMGGEMPVEEAPMEEAPAGEDQMTQMIMQIVETQDAEMALQFVMMLAEQMGLMGAPQEAPVFKKGGKMKKKYYNGHKPGHNKISRYNDKTKKSKLKLKNTTV